MKICKVVRNWISIIILQKCIEHNKICLPVFWYCDGVSDCPLGTDEIGCSCEEQNLVSCLTAENITICMPASWACRGHPQCLHFDWKVCEKAQVDDVCAMGQFWCHFEEDPANILIFQKDVIM